MPRIAQSFLLLALLFAGCDGANKSTTPGPRTGKPVVMTTMYPVAYFAERIGGDLIEVVCPVPAGEDPIFWQPDEETISRYQKADLIILNGAEFAKWVAMTPLPRSKIVDTAKPFAETLIRFEKATTHAHGPAGKHAHEGIDGHTWMDPVNAKAQAEEIRKALVRLVPEHEERINGGFAKLAENLDGLDATLKAVSNDSPLLTSHPAYNYVAREYGWKVVNLHLDPEEMPSDEVFGQIRKILETHPAKHLLWESDPKPEIEKRLKTELGLTSVTFSPCELYDGEDYLTVMRENVERMKPVFAADRSD